MANQPTAAASATRSTATNGTNEARTVDIGDALLKLLQERLNEIEVEDAKAENRPVEEVNAAEELSRAKTIQYMITTDALVWRRGKPAPNMKSSAYNILAMFRADPEDPETDVRVYLIPSKPITENGDERLLCYTMTSDKIDVICDAFLDVETFLNHVADDYLRAMGIDEPDESEGPELPGTPATPAGAGAERVTDPTADAD